MTAIDKLIAKVAEHADAYGFPSIAEAESDLGALRAENARLRDCELMLRAHMADEAFRPQFIRTRARGPKDAWSLRFREDTGGGTWAWSSKTVLADDGTGLPLLDAAARERIGKELEGK